MPDLGLLDWLIAPHSRTFIAFLLSALIISVCWVMLDRPQRSCYLKQLGQKNYWWNPSTRQDYTLVVMNTLLFSVLGISWLILSLSVANQAFALLDASFEPRALAPMPSTALFIGFSLSLILIDDLSRYGLHRLLHWGWFWRIHQLHHSATALTPISFLRVHPLEKGLYQLRSSSVYGACTGIFFFLVGQHPQLWLIFGIAGASLLFNLFGANLRHSMIPISYGKLEYLLISPLQHQLHHSPSLSRHNYGSLLSIWDLLFSSWAPGKQARALPSEHKPLIDQLLLKRLD